MTELDDHTRNNGLLGARFIEGEESDPAVVAARVIAEQALSILTATEATASDIRRRSRRSAEELARDDGVALAMGRLRTISRELDGLAVYVDRRLEMRRHAG